uniref:Uncharacterized protein n=1 Tax=Acidianus ambivalens TaxID=2283 RepID=G0KZE8_ACIAM|nr:hypothetical protein [Acidianus ambivalens]
MSPSFILLDIPSFHLGLYITISFFKYGSSSSAYFPTTITLSMSTFSKTFSMILFPLIFSSNLFLPNLLLSPAARITAPIFIKDINLLAVK